MGADSKYAMRLPFLRGSAFNPVLHVSKVLPPNYFVFLALFKKCNHTTGQVGHHCNAALQFATYSGRKVSIESSHSSLYLSLAGFKRGLLLFVSSLRLLVRSDGFRGNVPILRLVTGLGRRRLTCKTAPRQCACISIKQLGEFCFFWCHFGLFGVNKRPPPHEVAICKLGVAGCHNQAPLDGSAAF